MEGVENCIQLKIDSLVSNINKNSKETQSEEKNDITNLISYIHCLDLYDFLGSFSKIQKNEILVQIAIIYDTIGYTESSIEYLNQALILIPNAPSVILFQSGLYASMNKLEIAQKFLVKYKYLIGENKYYNYVHDFYRLIYYFLLDYEENILLREINLLENKYSSYAKDNIIILYINYSIFNKLKEKFKNIDDQRAKKFSIKCERIKEKLKKNKKNEFDFITDQGIKIDNITKVLSLIYPQIFEYKPKKLTDYMKSFNKGFGLFFNLIKIVKIIKLKIETKKYKKIFKIKTNKQNNELEHIIKTIENNSDSNDNFTNRTDEESVCESIKNLCKSIWLKNYVNNSGKNNNIINNINNNYANMNYYIRKGYYSRLNLKENILKNLDYNDLFKKNKIGYDSFNVETSNDNKNNNNNDSLNINNKTEIIRNKKNNNIFSNIDVNKINDKNCLYIGDIDDSKSDKNSINIFKFENLNNCNIEDSSIENSHDKAIIMDKEDKDQDDEKEEECEKYFKEEFKSLGKNKNIEEYTAEKVNKDTEKKTKANQIKEHNIPKTGSTPCNTSNTKNTKKENDRVNINNNELKIAPITSDNRYYNYKLRRKNKNLKNYNALLNKNSLSNKLQLQKINKTNSDKAINIQNNITNNNIIETDYGKNNENNINEYWKKKIEKRKKTKKYENHTEKIDLKILKDKLYNMSEKINIQNNDSNKILNKNKKGSLKMINKKNNFNSRSIANITKNSNVITIKKSFINNLNKDLSKYKSMKYLKENKNKNSNELKINPYTSKKKDKINFNTINLNFKKSKAKSPNYIKFSLFHSFLDNTKDKKNDINKYDAFNKIKLSPSGNLINMKTSVKSFCSKEKTKKKNFFANKHLLSNSIRYKSVAHFLGESVSNCEFFKYKINANKSRKMIKNNTINRSTSKSNAKSIL